MEGEEGEMERREDVGRGVKRDVNGVWRAPEKCREEKILGCGRE